MLTSAQRFLAADVDSDAQERVYKTGVLGPWGDSGLEYLGRNDDQVKIRGYRLELGQIEAQLPVHVKDVVVVARDDAEHQRLVAYVAQRQERDPSAEDLRAPTRGFRRTISDF